VNIDGQVIRNNRDRTRVHYHAFSHVFLYITEQCQLRCEHCYMGDRLNRGLVMPYEKAINIVRHCRRLGAAYITFLGGEPTLHPNLPQMVDYALSIGYAKVNIDTNGLLVDRLKCISPSKINYIRVSLDGATREINDKVRGTGTYERITHSIKQLVNAGYQVAITCTIFQFSIQEAQDLLALADRLGIKLVNYHVFSEEGLGISHPDWSLAPQDWVDFCELLETIKNNYKTSIWYPPTWSTPKKIEIYVTEGYQGCLGASLDRLSIFPDGVCHICSVLFDESVYFGLMKDQEFILNRDRNEFEMFTKAILGASEPWLSGCPAERILEKHGKKKTPPQLIPMCRCWKSQS
jgi:MoaA/NifB/PqqE/SkfB family radical SAM enzyme